MARQATRISAHAAGVGRRLSASSRAAASASARTGRFFGFLCLSSGKNALPAELNKFRCRVMQDLILVAGGSPRFISDKFSTDRPFIIGFGSDAGSPRTSNCRLHSGGAYEADPLQYRVANDLRLPAPSPPKSKKSRRPLLLERCKFLPGNPLCDFYRLRSHNLNVSWLLGCDRRRHLSHGIQRRRTNCFFSHRNNREGCREARIVDNAFGPFSGRIDQNLWLRLMRLAAAINQGRWEKHIRDEQHREQKTTDDGKVPKERHTHGLR